MEEQRTQNKIFAVLVAVSLLMVVVSTRPSAALRIGLIVPAALVEAGLVLTFFMHLQTKKKTVHLLVVLTIVLFLGMLLGTWLDLADCMRGPNDL